MKLKRNSFKTVLKLFQFHFTVWTTLEGLSLSVLLMMTWPNVEFYYKLLIAFLLYDFHRKINKF